MNGNVDADTGGPRIERLLRSPLEVTWSVTSRCNLRCPYCLEAATTEDAPEDASDGTLDLVLRELIANRVLKVYISGGEPLLVPSVPKYVARLRDSDAAVRLTTNGALVDDEMATRLAEARLSAAEVSLQPGEADRVRRAVSLLVARGIPTVLRIVVTPRNLSKLEEMVSPFAESGLERIALQEVMPLGRASTEAEKYALTVDDLDAARALTDGLKERWGDRFIGFASTTLADAALGRPAPCTLDARVRKGCEIRPDGNVIPCTPSVVYGVSNVISKKGLSACWRDLPRLYAPFLKARPGGACEACASLDSCRGGCRAISFGLTGEESGGNPVCRFLKPVPDPPCRPGAP